MSQLCVRVSETTVSETVAFESPVCAQHSHVCAFMRQVCVRQL